MSSAEDPDVATDGIPSRAQERIVVGVHGMMASAAAVRWAVREALLRQASVHLVFADDHDQYRRASYAGHPNVPRPDHGNVAGTALHAAEQLAIQVLPPGCLSSEVVDGSAAQVLIDRSTGADLLVLGSAYPVGQPVSQAPPAMSSVVLACLHGAACPVVVMAPDGEA